MMELTNKEILEQANAAVAGGDNEGFLFFCTDDVEWHFVGDRTIRGKEAVRQYMQETYKEPPQFAVDRFICESDTVAALGNISLPDESGKIVAYAYCDVWRFRNGKMCALQAFVIAKDDDSIVL